MDELVTELSNGLLKWNSQPPRTFLVKPNDAELVVNHCYDVRYRVEGSLPLFLCPFDRVHEEEFLLFCGQIFNQDED